MALSELARFPNRIDAEIARGVLESAGLHAVCFDGGRNIAEGVGFLIPVRLMVLSEDLEEAREILATPPDDAGLP